MQNRAEGRESPVRARLRIVASGRPSAAASPHRRDLENLKLRRRPRIARPSASAKSCPAPGRAGFRERETPLTAANGRSEGIREKWPRPTSAKAMAGLRSFSEGGRPAENGPQSYISARAPPRSGVPARFRRQRPHSALTPAAARTTLAAMPRKGRGEFGGRHTYLRPAACRRRRRGVCCSGG